MNTVIRLIISYIITFAIYDIGGFEATDIMLGVIFVMAYMILTFFGRLYTAESGIDVSAAESVADKRVIKASCIVSAIWTLLYVIYLGGRIVRGLDNPLFRAVYIVFATAGLYAIFYYSIRAVLTAIMSWSAEHDDDPLAARADTDAATDITYRFPVRRWVSYLVFIFICMLPLFVLNFPGTMTVDSFEQFAQVMGVAAYSDHHPWVHTLVIKLFYSMGYGITGNVYSGIATYTIAQMIILAMAAAYAIVSMTDDQLNKVSADASQSDKDKSVVAYKGKIIRILMLLGFIIYPYNLAYSITMWKDVIFAASVLTFTVTIFRMFIIRPTSADVAKPAVFSEIDVRDIILYIISGLGMCMLRHNGLYAYILTTLILVIVGLVSRRRVAVLVGATIFTLLVTFIVTGPVQKAYNVEKGDYAHNIPIPLQQIARVIHDGCEIDVADLEMLERINTTEFLHSEYTPGGADPVMQWVVFGDSDYLNEHKSEYIALWIRLGLKHPGEYLMAYIDQTKGYYTTMMPEQTEYYGILANDDGLEPKPLLGATVRIKINEIVSKIHGIIPVYGILYSMGACFMLMILGAAIIILKNEKARLLTYLPVFTLTLTLLIATPLVADLRYAYPLMLSMPTLIAITLTERR